VAGSTGCTVLAVAGAALIDNHPEWSPETVKVVNSMGGWKLPIFIFSLFLMIRLIWAPYSIYKKTRQERDIAIHERASTIAGLEESKKPKLTFSNSAPVPNSDERINNRAYQILVSNISSGDVENCSVLLKKIERDGILLWSGQIFLLAFQPCTDLDAKRKTFTPGLE
jgi:hypothetical protein